MTISAVGSVLLGHVQEAAALAFLYSIAEALEDHAMDKARTGLRALLKLVPETVTVLGDRKPRTIRVENVRVGHLTIVGPGERIASDGVIRTGQSSLDTSAITGESMPLDVFPGTEVNAGSINGSGGLEVQATAAGTDNSLAAMVMLVQRAQEKRG